MHRTFAKEVLLFCSLYSLAGTASAAGGYVDQVDTAVISGWACNLGNSRWVHVFDGEQYIGSTTSNTVKRADTASLCAGSEWTGFSMETPRLSPGTHAIHVYASDSEVISTQTPLPGEATLVVPSANFVGPSPFGVIENTTASLVSGWACDSDTSGPVELEVLVQFNSTGPLVPLTSGLTSSSRAGVAGCGVGGARNFAIQLPSVRGGTHNLVVRAKNVGAGTDKYLEEYQPYIRRVNFPYAASLNADPQVMNAADCWYQRPDSTHYIDCPTGMPPWIFSVSKTVFTERAPAPQADYAGPQARVRYDGLPQGTVLKFETYDTTSEMYPWDYNFQALSTNMQEVVLSSGSNLALEVTLRIRPDWNYSDPTHGPEPGIETGTSPWLNLIVGSVFRHKVTGVVYFIEAMPYVQGGVFNETSIGGPQDARNSRIRFSSLDGAVSLPTQMLVGETRSFEMDLRTAFAAAFATEPNQPHWEDLIYTGSYVGTEQYGKHRFAIDVSRISVHN